jgi:hypothetical protein
MQGKTPLGQLVQIVLVGPAGMAHSGLAVGLGAGVPDLGRFHLCRFKAAEDARRETSQAIHARCFHRYEFFSATRYTVKCRMENRPGAGAFIPPPATGRVFPLHPIIVTTPHDSSLELLGAERHALSSQSGSQNIERGIMVSHTREKGFKGFVNAMQHILQDLGVDGPVFRSECFDIRQLGGLLREGDAPAAQPIGLFPFLQSGVVQLGAQGELFVQYAFLLLGRIETVLEGFPHTSVFFSGRKKRKLHHFHCTQVEY